MLNQYCQRVAFLAQKAVLYEVTVSPKPGLVDRYNAGAHQDMDFYTFMASSSSLFEGFYGCALAGFQFPGQDVQQLLAQIRSIGIQAEAKMFNATQGVNTHKGIIFSLGLICAIAGHIYRQEQDEVIVAELICAKVAEMTQGLVARELGALRSDQALTNGEKLYQQYKLQGIRGEVESGFPTVREKGLIILRRIDQFSEIALNDLLLHILLNIMTVCEDSNVVSRHNIQALGYVQDYAKTIIESGGMLVGGGRKRVLQMDQEFIQKNISPGGSADLLAVTMLLGMLEGIQI